MKRNAQSKIIECDYNIQFYQAEADASKDEKVIAKYQLAVLQQKELRTGEVKILAFLETCTTE